MNPIVSRGIAKHYFIEKIHRFSSFAMPNNHLHDEYELYFLLEGEGDFYFNNTPYSLSSGDIVIINKNIPHRTDFTNNVTHIRYLIEINEEKIVTLLNQLLELDLHEFFKKDFEVFSLNEKDISTVSAIFDEIIYELQQRKEKFELAATIKLSELLLLLFRYERDTKKNIRVTTQDKREELISSILEYIHANLSEDISLDSIAQHFFMNKSYLGRIFKQVTHYTISDYINIERVRIAKLYLLRTDLSIEEISNRVGFKYASYFTRIFKKHTEVSPLQYKKKKKRY